MSITQLTRPEIRTLDDELLQRCRSRAAIADERNEFFHDDLTELHEIGYTLAAVPVHHGGWGLDLATLAAEQRRLATAAPATALALSMHFYWTGLAAELERLGDPSLAWILTEAAAGKLFAAGHGEAGNDVPVVMSSATAERVGGGYRFTGRKMFGSLGPVWSYLGVHAVDWSDPNGPAVVHGFVARDAEGVEVEPTWNTMSMRPTQSHDTVLDGAFVPDDRIGCVHPAGDGSAPFVALMGLWALTLIANVYLGIAERAFDLAVASAKKKSSIAIPRATFAYNPMIQHRIAEMFLELDAARATVDRLAADWVGGVDHGERWPMQVYAAKWRAVEAAKKVVDIALDVSGGSGMFKGNELERLYRDVRAGGFHPASDALTHEIVGKIALGISTEQPRW
jgi:alkylation response protein AidB-like acyl-CoA dehydrogenase